MLSSADSRYKFAIILGPVLDQPHLGWMKYELVFEAPGRPAFHCQSTDTHPLYFDCTVQPEIPALCAGIRTLIESGAELTFEPIDDRDFRLTVRVHEGKYHASVDVHDRPVPLGYGWPDGVHVAKVQLLRFADEMEAAYRKLLT